MFKILDGRENFFQWDINQKLIVEDETIKLVHFDNGTLTEALVVEVKDGVAEVPNILLQESWNIKAFGYDGNNTKHKKSFKVEAKAKPADYVYTETEVRTWEELYNRTSPEAIKEAVGDVSGAGKNYIKLNNGEVRAPVSIQAVGSNKFIALLLIPLADASGVPFYEGVPQALIDIAKELATLPAVEGVGAEGFFIDDCDVYFYGDCYISWKALVETCGRVFEDYGENPSNKYLRICASEEGVYITAEMACGTESGAAADTAEMFRQVIDMCYTKGLGFTLPVIEIK